jgi:hypothetical protein
MNNQPTSLKSSLGRGLFGCLGGLLVGLVSGVVGLALLSLAMALVSPIPAPPPAATDVHLTIHESFLNKFVQMPDGDQTQVDILPGDRFNLIIDTAVSLLGVSVPVQMTGLFQLQLNGQALEIRLIDTKISGAALPPEAANFLRDALPDINQELNKAIKEMTTILGAPLTLVNLGSDDEALWLEARETP